MGTLTKLLSSQGGSMKSQVEEKAGEEVLAVTAHRVVAYKCTGVADDEGGTNFRIVVRGQAGSWPREGVVAAIPAGEHDGTLHLAGESIPITPTPTSPRRLDAYGGKASGGGSATTSSPRARPAASRPWSSSAWPSR